MDVGRYPSDEYLVNIGHWTPRRIGKFWLTGLAIETILIVLPLAIEAITRKPPTPAQRQLQRLKARVDSVNKGLLPPPPPMSDSQRAMLRSFVEDSLGFRFIKRGETTEIVAVTPRARAIGANFEKGLQGLGKMLVTVFTVLAVVYLPIPVTLVAVTVLWLWQRRRFNQGVADA